METIAGPQAAKRRLAVPRSGCGPVSQPLDVVNSQNFASHQPPFAGSIVISDA
jgi:hypothetical protein